MKPQNYPLLAIGDILIIGIAEKSQHTPVDTGRRLDDIRQIVLFGLLIVILQVLAAAIGMLGQIIVAPAGNTFQFRPAHREKEVDIETAQSIMGQLFLAMLAEFEVFFAHAQFLLPVDALINPVFKPFVLGARFDEVLDFHLLEFTVAEDEVAGGNLIAEGLAHLGDAEGQLFAGSVDHILEIDEHALGGLRSQIDYRDSILNRSHKGLEHQVELAGLG